MSVRDSQRSKVYAAEDRAFRNENALISIEAAQKLVDSICESAALREMYPRAAKAPTVKKGHGRLKGGYFCKVKNTIELNESFFKRWIVLHELAHHLSPPSERFEKAAHGREYAECYLLLVRVYMGRGWADALEREFKAKRVAYKPKRAYSISDEERERRRERAKSMSAKRWQ